MGQLEDMEASSVEQDQVFHPYTAHIQTPALHNDRKEESTQSTPIQKSLRTDTRHIVSDERLGSAMRSETP